MIISVRNLNVRYRNVHALSDVSLDIRENEIFGFIGHNGAGKTTLMECMEGLRNNYSGTIEVMGMDPVRDRKVLYRHIGVQLQETVYQDRIRVCEIGKLFQSFYRHSADFEDLLFRFGLGDRKRSFIGKLSGGQRQRLSIILALMGRPRILFLDEITTGLDPSSRREIWQMIKALKKEGMTVVLSTHYMDEAEYLCDRIAVMNRGCLAAAGSVMELKRGRSLEQAFMEIGRESDITEELGRYGGMGR